MEKNGSMVLVGCGRMGGALLEGWRARGLAMEKIWVVEPEPAIRLPLATPCVAPCTVASAADLPADLHPEIVVFAVKPQSLEAVVPDYRRFATTAVFLSIAAGRPLAWFANTLGAEAALIRAMPNTPAAVQRGMTVVCGNARIDAARRALCTGLLEAVGAVTWIADENLMDAVTAVSGSGPAYVFLVVESLTRAGQAAGLPTDLAERLARQTVIGAGELLARAPEPAAVLRQNVTSPGGTTAAALAMLMDPKNGLDPLMTQAVLAATARSRELSR
ncbi:MAG: pyrroline-5-carboxylate reductase [Rhodospirillaceae bacterium]|nr:MAG: pyrroline-5-carboxylate reductase [Rhodospirillaceae bacterium]